MLCREDVWSKSKCVPDNRKRNGQVKVLLNEERVASTMKIYDEGTLEEWSRRLCAKFGSEFHLYSTEDETMERWKDHLSNMLGYKFEFQEDQDETLKNWSKLIGG